MNQYSSTYKPVEAGSRYQHKSDGWYEVIEILPNKRLVVRFDNTGGIVEACKTAVMYQRISDPLGNRFHKVGDRFQNKHGDWYTFIRRIDKRTGIVKFDNTGTEVEVFINNMKNGNVKDHNKPSILGIGFIGRRRSLLNIKSNSYKLWRNVIARCYDATIIYKRPTYKDCCMCDEWHNFTKFEKWFDENYVDGYCLDKDILYKGNKEYSPNTCCFVPNEINVLFTKRQNKRGELPIGVLYSESKKRFKAQFTKGSEREYLGYFDTKEEAFLAYKKAKESYIQEVANKWKEKIAPNVYKAMMRYEVEITD